MNFLTTFCLHIFRISEEEYVNAITEEISKVVKIQEDLDIDVLVHGEPEVKKNYPVTYASKSIFKLSKKTHVVP